jgi:predicted aminopeptidase
VLVAACLLGSSGCRTTYLTRLAWEQMRYLGRARPVAELMDAETDPVRLARLQLVLDLRAFAKRAGLDPAGSFAEVADTESTTPFHVVTAAWADRLEAYTWWYPIVGAVPYRGYFEREAAEEFAETLRDENLDVRIVKASAYSTLGWFDDPLPSGLLTRGPVELASVVLHELVHQHYFLPGSVDFNETLANAVGYRLAERFFEERGEAGNVAAVVEARRRWLERSRVLDDLALRLEAWFDDAAARDLPFEEMLAGRNALYEAARDELEAAGVLSGESRQDAIPLDNATFLAVYRYARDALLLDRFVVFHGGGAGALVALEDLDTDGDPWEAIAEALPPATGS